MDRNMARVREEGERPVPAEPAPRTSAKWKQRPERLYKYVDDHLQVLQINTETVDNVAGKKKKHATISQNTFRRVLRKAEGRGMKVNTNKTGMLCISDALTFRADAYLEDEDGQEVTSEGTESIKILGFHFNRRPTVHAHVASLKKRFYERWWSLYHLKHHCFTKEELVTVYKTCIRPVFDFCAVVYHPLLNDKQDQQLERLQRQALKIIFGTNISYTEMRRMAGIETLRQRRINLSDKFAGKCAGSEKFGHWFPEKRAARGGRFGEKYVEEFARCERLFNSPLFYMRRRLNGKTGLEYWERHRERRSRN